MDHGPPFLIVEDDRRAANALARLTRSIRPSLVAETLEEAREVLASEPAWSGWFIDVELPDGSGLDVLAAARARHPEVPALVITGRLEPALVNRAFALRAGYVCKPVTADQLLPFVLRCVAAETLSDERLLGVLEELSVRHALSKAESELLRFAVAGVSREDMLERKGVSENTLKSQIRTLLQKVGAANLDELALRAFRTAAAMDPGPPTRRPRAPK